MSDISLIVNPASGRGKTLRWLPEVERALQSSGRRIRTLPTESSQHATDLARQAIDREETIVTLGGDGLVHAVVQAIAKSNCVLGVIPAGSGNDFARTLGITNSQQGIDAVLRGTVRKVDLGKAGEKYFTCIASVGFDSTVIEEATKVRLVRGALIYPYATLKALFKWKPVSFVLDLDDRYYRFEGFSVAVANCGYYGGGMLFAPGADPSDGEFQVITVSKVSRLRFLLQATKVFRGGHIENPEVETFVAKRVRLSVDGDFAVFADGERIGPPPMEISIVPDAVQVFVPK